MDGASRQARASLGLQLKAPTKEIIEQAIRLNFLASNNEAEYEVSITEPNLAIFVSSEKIVIRSDHQLVVGRVNGEYEIRDQRMAKYVSLINLQQRSFAAWQLEHVPRSSNEKADALVAIAASLPIKKAVLLPVYYQLKPSITTN